MLSVQKISRQTHERSSRDRKTGTPAVDAKHLHPVAGVLTPITARPSVVTIRDHPLQGRTRARVRGQQAGHERRNPGRWLRGTLLRVRSQMDDAQRSARHAGQYKDPPMATVPAMGERGKQTVSRDLVDRETDNGMRSGPSRPERSPALSVVLPAFNQEETIAGNLREILRRLETTGVDFEVILVSDGSRDATHAEARALADPRVRVLRYERNQGKGYALRTGSAAARGEWVAWIDSDLDLDPSRIGAFLERARAENLDIVIGSKRHPASAVSYPVRRRVYSWLYQQLVRTLFALNVRDTQVGMKLFRREVLDEALPVVLVKRYAFDLEVLAVANSFGFDRISEAPITLEYQFAGSGMNWRAITQALWDTAAVFYRLRIRNFYGRRRVLARRMAQNRTAPLPSLSVLLAPDRADSDPSHAVERLRAIVPANTQILVAWPGSTEADIPTIAGAEVRAVGSGPRPQRLAAALETIDSDVVALVEDAGRPSDGWAQAALRLLVDPEVGAVVGPTVAQLSGDLHGDAAGVLSESRIGVGDTRIRHHVGRLRTVDDFPTRNIFLRTRAVRRALAEGYPLDDQLCAVLNGRHGLAVLCSPDVVTTVDPVPLWRPYLSNMHRSGRASGMRIGAGHRPHPRTCAPVALLLGALSAPWVLRRGGPLARLWMIGAGAYAVTIAAFAGVLMVLHRRPRLVGATATGAVASHVAFAAGVLRGIVAGFARRAARSRMPGR